MKNVTELRDALADQYQRLLKGEIDTSVCKELTNTAGKMINSAKVQLDYQVAKGNGKKIKFLESE